MGKRDSVIDNIYLGYFKPIAMSTITLAVANIVDSLVVGRKLGEDGLAAIGFASPLYMFFIVFYISLAVGGAIRSSEHIGNGHNEEANKVFHIAFECIVLISLIMVIIGLFFTGPVLTILGVNQANETIYSYTYKYVFGLMLSCPTIFINQSLFAFVRNDDDPTLSSAAFILGNILDVTLCILLVGPFDMGIIGSIWSTVIGQSISAFILCIHFFSGKHILSFAYEKIDWKIIRNIFRIGFSSANQYVAQFVFIILMNRILEKKMPEYGVAIFDVIVNLSYIAMVFIDTAENSLQPICSTLYGERNVKGMHRTRELALKTGMIGTTLIVLAFVVFAPKVAALFGLSTENSIYMGSIAIRLFALSIMLAGPNVIMSVYYQSVGRDKLTYVISILRGFILLFINAFIFAPLKNELFWMIYIVAEAVTMAVWLIIRKLNVFQSEDSMPDEKEICIFEMRKTEDISCINERIEQFCEKHDISVKKCIYITSATEEVCCSIIDNAVIKPGRELLLKITICIEPDHENIRLCIRDNACEFNPFDMKTGKITDADMEEDELLAGLGIMMVKNKAKEFYYHRFQNFNTMIVIV